MRVLLGKQNKQPYPLLLDRKAFRSNRILYFGTDTVLQIQSYTGKGMKSNAKANSQLRNDIFDLSPTQKSGNVLRKA